MRAEVQKYLHFNCTHGDLDGDSVRKKVGVSKTTPVDPADNRMPSERSAPKVQDTNLVMYLIATLLFLLLLVHLCILSVLIKRSKPIPPTSS